MHGHIRYIGTPSRSCLGGSLHSFPERERSRPPPPMPLVRPRQGPRLARLDPGSGIGLGAIPACRSPRRSCVSPSFPELETAALDFADQAGAPPVRRRARRPIGTPRGCLAEERPEPLRLGPC